MGDGTRLRVAVTVEQSWHAVPGGTAWSVLELLRALRERDDLDLIGVSARHSSPPPEPWTVPIEVAALPLPRLALYETWHAPASRFPKVERATGPIDVVHATAIAYPATDAPVVVTVHDLSFRNDRRRATRYGHHLFGRGTELARRNARLVACPSRASADECIAAGFDPGRVRVVPWGVRQRRVEADEVARVLARHGLDAPFVLFTGTVEPRKNLPALLAAFERLEHRDVELVLTGPSGWNEDVGEVLQRLGSRARVLGFVDRAELDALLAGATVFAYPSLQEGFGLPVLEAMVQGTAVVTARGTATEEVAGEAAVLVDPCDVDAIAAAIDGVLDDDAARERVGRAARARAATFTWERSAAAYADLYAEAARHG